MLGSGAVEDSVSETIKVANAEANALQNLGFVVTSFCITVGIVVIKRSEDFFEPVVNSLSTSTEFG